MQDKGVNVEYNVSEVFGKPVGKAASRLADL